MYGGSTENVVFVEKYFCINLSHIKSFNDV